ncbi:MAG: hypothetical protein ABI718_09150 [Acidobacteriota bacterium]
MALGILELICTVGRIVTEAFLWRSGLTVAATVLAIEGYAAFELTLRASAPLIRSHSMIGNSAAARASMMARSKATMR